MWTNITQAEETRRMYVEKTWIGIKHATFLLPGVGVSGFPALTHLCLHLFPPSSRLCKSCWSRKPNKAKIIG